MSLIEQTNLLNTGGATLSACGTYRYHLWRTWDEQKPTLAFLMLNPSTADAFEDDRTISTCLRVARQHGYGKLEVMNLFAFRSTDPKGLNTTPDPVGPHNNAFLSKRLPTIQTCIAAWGSPHKRLSARAEEVRTLCHTLGLPLHALHINANGTPHHPLYLRLPEALLPYPFQ